MSQQTGFLPVAIANALLKKKQASTPSPVPDPNRPNLAFLLTQALKKVPSTPTPTESEEEADISGATMPMPLVRLRRHPRGHLQAFDADGNVADVDDTGLDETGLDLNGADDMGADSLLSGIDDELDELGAECDELGADLDMAGDADQVGASAEAIERHIEHTQSQIARHQQHLASIKPPFAQLKKRSTMNKISRLQAKLSKLKGEARAAKRKFAPGVAAASRTAANNPGARREIGGREAARIASAQAKQGLRFNVGASAPGAGRAIEIGMYPSGVTSPRVLFTIPASPFKALDQVLFSEDVPYEKYRITGFRNTERMTSGSTSGVYVYNLTTKGNANLLANDNPTSAQQYATDLDHLVGLRDYPVVKSPNVARVTAYAEGDASSEGDIIAYSASVVCEEIYDEVFGPGAVGPSAG